MTDKEILSIAKGFRRGLLGKHKPDMMCYAVSNPLAAYFNFLGIRCGAYECTVDFPEHEMFYGHWIIVFPDGKILDPTASQFNKHGMNMPDIYMGAVPANYKM